MADSKVVSRTVSHVILDLDGTLLNTDGLVNEVLKVLLLRYGKYWDSKKAHKIVGRTPTEAASIILEDYELPCNLEEFVPEITQMFHDQCCNIKALPGANRLIKHLKSSGIPMALASNSPRSNIETKISFHGGWRDSFSVIVGGDEVVMGKPSPEIFIEASKRLNADPINCLVLEDSLPGVTAGKAAGTVVVAVPSIPKQAHLYSCADTVINSLLDLHPEKWGLPPFDDWIVDTLPIDPWFLGGPVIKGFGRGSKILGIPTVHNRHTNRRNMRFVWPDAKLIYLQKIFQRYFRNTLRVYTLGGLACQLGGIYKMVMSIGWNPYFDNTEKTVEPWLLHDFGEDFYGEELRLAIVGYIRPEANFPSLESLIARIHEDGKIADRALDLPIYAGYKDSPYLKIPRN